MAKFDIQAAKRNLAARRERRQRVLDERFDRSQSRWHQDLLERMALETPEVRPAVIRRETFINLRAGRARNSSL